MTGPLHGNDPARIGPYRLHARLGGGGMGQVFLGRSPGGHTVAVKVVRPELADDTDFRRRFANEVAAARKVGGFYTAPVVDADPEADPPWLATAYIPGPSLHSAVAEHGPLPLHSVTALGAGLAEGLAAVHAQGLVHRDLKPANVLLAEDGPRLIDFGIARALDATSQTRTSTVLGTAAFMSPEQAVADKGVDPASDVFSLGCVLAFAATGHSPFGEGPVHAVVYRVVHADPDLSGLPAPLAHLAGACLAKDPTARPGLDRVLADLTAATPADRRGPAGPWLPQALTGAVTLRTTLVLEPDRLGRTGGFDSDVRAMLHTRFRDDMHTLIARRRPAGPSPGPAPAGSGPVRPAASARGPHRPRAVSHAPEVFELTTAAERVARYAGNVLRGLATGAVVPVFLFLLALYQGARAPYALEAALDMVGHSALGLFAILLFLVGFWEKERQGRDLLVIDGRGVSVVDKRWLRLRDRSLSLPWERLQGVGLVPDTSGGSHLLVLKPSQKSDRLTSVPTAPGLPGWRVLAAVPLTPGVERATMVPRLHTALAHFGGDVYAGALDRR